MKMALVVCEKNLLADLFSIKHQCNNQLQV